MLTVGQKVLLKNDIIEPATGDHPPILLGVADEEVTIISIHQECGFLCEVEGTTRPGEPWYATSHEFKVQS